VIDPSVGDATIVLGARHPNGFDGLLDAMNDSAGFGRYTRVVRRGGTALSTTFSADERALERAGLRGGNIDLHPTHELLERLVREIVDRQLPVPLERRVGLADAPSVLAELKAGRGHGKTVVDVHS
jgi:NADPH:quinone reductase-like Zn-dependent oxidoreductase